LPILILTSSPASEQVTARLLQLGAADIAEYPGEISSLKPGETDAQTLREMGHELRAKVKAVAQKLPSDVASASTRGNGATVLVVEDSATQQEIIRHTLSQAGYEVHVAARGRLAVQIAQDLQPDVIVLDYLLPEMNGIAVLKSVRDAGLDTVVIMLTGHGSEEVAAAALYYRADYYVIKPVVPWQLLDLVQTSLQQRRTARDLRRLTQLHLSVLDNLPVGVFVLDRERRIRGWNQAMAYISGHPGEEVTGRHASDAWTLFGVLDSDGRLGRLGGGEQQLIKEMEAINASGARMILSVRLFKLMHEDVIIGVVEDVTSNIEMRDKLLRAERMATVSRMVVTASHEINGPLTVILSSTQFLRDELGSSLTKRAGKDLRTIADSVVQIQRVISRMARMSEPIVTSYLP